VSDSTGSGVSTAACHASSIARSDDEVIGHHYGLTEQIDRAREGEWIADVRAAIRPQLGQQGRRRTEHHRAASRQLQSTSSPLHERSLATRLVWTSSIHESPNYKFEI
jgi:hypothetical protein